MPHLRRYRENSETENSPAFQGWVSRLNPQVPKGRLKRHLVSVIRSGAYEGGNKGSCKMANAEGAVVISAVLSGLGIPELSPALKGWAILKSPSGRWRIKPCLSGCLSNPEK